MIRRPPRSTLFPYNDALPISRSARRLALVRQWSSTIVSSSGRWSRSEEHTSELQSHSDLVCRLLLEKKKDIAAPVPAVQQQRRKFEQGHLDDEPNILYRRNGL